ALSAAPTHHIIIQTESLPSVISSPAADRTASAHADERMVKSALQILEAGPGDDSTMKAGCEPRRAQAALAGLQRSTGVTDGMLPSMGDYVAINKAMWDERAPVHAASTH